MEESGGAEMTVYLDLLVDRSRRSRSECQSQSEGVLSRVAGGETPPVHSAY